MTAWHQCTTAEVVRELQSDLSAGLSAAEATRRQAQYGANRLVEVSGRGPWQILAEQLRSAMVALLFVAAIVSVFLEEYIDAAAVVVIVLLNATIGFVQDYRAEQALAALKRLTVPRMRVRRDGSLREVSAGDLVPGDLVILEVGNLVPADCRVLESFNLKLQESSLTGESEPVDKQVDAIPAAELPVADRQNMAYMGTTVTYGHGTAIVTEIGMATELGQIASSLQSVEHEPTPLQRRLAQLGRTLACVSLGIVALVFALGILVGEPWRLMLMTSLSLAVAIVPEGLPAVATVALAIGARRMFKRQALIRKLPAVETLGSVTVICTDKTGTLTENRMTVTVLDTAGRRLELTGSRDRGKAGTGGGDRDEATQASEIAGQSSFLLLLGGAALCSDAELVEDLEGDETAALGEPTEAALVVAAARFGLSRRELVREFPRIDEVPFDSQRKRMTTLHQCQTTGNQAVDAPPRQPLVTLLHRLDQPSAVAFMKGAVDSVLKACQFAWIDDQARPLDEAKRQRILASNNQLAALGMRVLGVAFRTWRTRPSTADRDQLEQDLIFVGMLAMIDPPRPEVRQAVARCLEAGIRPIMITGDHPLTAMHIATQLGIAEQDRTLVGPELAKLSPTQLRAATADVSVFARVAPRDKLHLVQALQKSGEVVAMTGDGVNDAPALKQAHIGVAMGQIGTDVSKEVSDMVLLDDNFATIVNAVEEGRVVYDNIRKFVKYTMTSNAGEVVVMVLGPLVGMPLPLMPLQILWVNLVTDGLPGLALAVEPAERNTMQRGPYPAEEHVMGRGMWREIAWVGLLMGSVSLLMGYLQLSEGNAGELRWRTMVFTVLTLSQMGNALATRSTRDSLFAIGLFSNQALLGSVLLTFLLQMAVIYLPPLQVAFKTTSLTLGELLACLLLSTTVFWAVELQKLISRRRDAGRARLLL